MEPCCDLCKSCFELSSAVGVALWNRCCARLETTAEARRRCLQECPGMKDLPEEQFWATMSFFADSLGVNCEHCHRTPYEADIKPEKIKARQMIRMVRDLNARYFDGTQKVTCNSCHRGTTAPVAQPSLDAQHWMDFNRVEGPLPDGAGLIARYQKLTGVAAVAT